MNTKICNLDKKHCVPCEGGVKPLTREETNKFLSAVSDWEVDAQNKIISRRYIFKNFYKAMAFVNAVAWIANQENHHPDMEMGYNYCVVKYTTHAIDGLSENDFICAARVNALLESSG